MHLLTLKWLHLISILNQIKENHLFVYFMFLIHQGNGVGIKIERYIIIDMKCTLVYFLY